MEPVGTGDPFKDATNEIIKYCNSRAKGRIGGISNKKRNELEDKIKNLAVKLNKAIAELHEDTTLRPEVQMARSKNLSEQAQYLEDAINSFSKKIRFGGKRKKTLRGLKKEIRFQQDQIFVNYGKTISKTNVNILLDDLNSIKTSKFNRLSKKKEKYFKDQIKNIQQEIHQENINLFRGAEANQKDHKDVSGDSAAPINYDEYTSGIKTLLEKTDLLLTACDELMKKKKGDDRPLDIIKNNIEGLKTRIEEDSKYIKKSGHLTKTAKTVPALTKQEQAIWDEAQEQTVSIKKGAATILEARVSTLPPPPLEPLNALATEDTSDATLPNQTGETAQAAVPKKGSKMPDPDVTSPEKALSHGELLRQLDGVNSTQAISIGTKKMDTLRTEITSGTKTPDMIVTAFKKLKKRKNDKKSPFESLKKTIHFLRTKSSEIQALDAVKNKNYDQLTKDEAEKFTGAIKTGLTKSRGEKRENWPPNFQAYVSVLESENRKKAS
ncbi:hypothetical protein SCG7086_BI_00050 [Chlamydiales bacterium SCGC AG-110-P3]|nr:hypothetical protein SCG7086_BI_00050 [Chlamydiales bacterium SCGC AG-110-P3]